MEFNVENYGAWSIIKLSGKLNIHSAQEFKSIFKNNYKQSINILLDFSNVLTIDSVGIGCLVYCQNWINDKGGAIRIAGINDEVKIIFQVTRGYEVFEIYEDVQIAKGESKVAA